MSRRLKSHFFRIQFLLKDINARGRRENGFFYNQQLPSQKGSHQQITLLI